MSTEYIPGTCNIGKGEIRRRQLVALLGLFLTVSSATALISTDAARSSKFSIFLPAMVFSIGFVQSRKKFCLAYGFAGTFNFGKLGQLSRVANAAERKADRITAIKILAQSALLALAITVLFVIAPF
ncbi:MAG: hypothetical protein WCJ43_05830 [Actinomycetes bacterium]